MATSVRGSFNSRPSCDGRPAPDRPRLRRDSRFNSRPSCDGRPPTPSQTASSSSSFNSRPSCDGRRADLPHQRHSRDVSIHARRATGDHPAPGADHRARVSIHARRATGDAEKAAAEKATAVSIHARRATGDAAPTPPQIRCDAFQFTPVVRRATLITKTCNCKN